MKYIRFVMYAAVVAISVPFSAIADDIAGFCDCSEADTSSSKVTICHYPPGKDSNRHTIEVAQPAVSAHLAHGDVLGPCPEDEGEDKDSSPEAIAGSPCTCADGSVGSWVHGEVKGPESMREVHGQ
ncbi:hypothetical protein Ga0123462_1743 [Mariprofundus ferrinatatus]|uniref:Uncharacterized protein n=1 Tax=Mariprofundus ferrinatatus TaxID=1921087 RepID=A0A2K8L5J5_9PROT|nr:hypothetical protein [Mariprofundus ferrinatatus]ATX82590.1 hypothetical protein Ga0123462_1743 [Mariprofundus ferrinatatus]